MRVAITGAGGIVGRILTDGLNGTFDVVAADRAWRDGPLRRRQDTRRRSVARRLFDGADAVVDLAAVSDIRASWRTVLRNNLEATVSALESARVAGVTTFIFASSNHVTGGYERDEPYSSIVAGAYEGLMPDSIPRIGSRDPIRPDSPYAVAKAAGEAAARHYAEAFGLSVYCLRLGSVTESSRPSTPRSFATLLTHRDLVGLVEACLSAPSAGGHGAFAVLYGVSANRWRFWDLEEVRSAVGFVPQDDAEQWRAV